MVFAPLTVDANAELMKKVLEELRRREPRDDEPPAHRSASPPERSPALFEMN